MARGLLLPLLSITVLLWAAGTAAMSAPPRRLLQAPGGVWTPVPDAGDPHIQGLGNWAVGKHNNFQNDHLVFQQVSRAESQEVIGTDYRLHIKAAESAGGDPSEGTSFVAVVWESTGAGMRKLITFVGE